MNYPTTKPTHVKANQGSCKFLEKGKEQKHMIPFQPLPTTKKTKTGRFSTTFKWKYINNQISDSTFA